MRWRFSAICFNLLRFASIFFSPLRLLLPPIFALGELCGSKKITNYVNANRPGLFIFYLSAFSHVGLHYYNLQTQCTAWLGNQHLSILLLMVQWFYFLALTCFKHDYDDFFESKTKLTVEQFWLISLIAVLMASFCFQAHRLPKEWLMDMVPTSMFFFVFFKVRYLYLVPAQTLISLAMIAMNALLIVKYRKY